METAQKCLHLVMEVTPHVPDLLMHSTILLVLATHLLGEVLDFLGITNKMAVVLCKNALSVMLQLKQVLGISGHVRPATVLNQHGWGLPYRNLTIATTLSPPFPSEGSTDPPTSPARSSNNK
jgi:hypothetical protein